MATPRILLSTIVAICLVACAEAAPKSFESARPLQRVYVTQEADDMTGEPEQSERMNICTTWPVQLPKGFFWVTAAHCVVEEGQVYKGQFWIDGHDAEVVSVDGSVDLALLTSALRAPALTVSFKEPSPLQALIGVGYPFGSAARHIVTGVFSTKDDHDRNAYALPTASGFSGGPVLDAKDGTVVGVMQQSECISMTPMWCPVSRGAPVEVLRTFLGLEN